MVTCILVDQNAMVYMALGHASALGVKSTEIML